MNITVEGMKYEGKTTLAFFLACRIMDRMDTHKILIFDPKWAFKNHSPVCDGRERRLSFTEDIVEFEDMTHAPGDAVAFRPRFSFSQDDREVIAEDFSAFAEAIRLEQLLKHPPEHPVVILLDEAYNLQGGVYVHPVLAAANRLATEGKIYIIQAVHGPKEIAPLMRRQMDEFYLFRQNDPNDLDVIEERCGAECREIVARLPLHHVLKFNAKDRTFQQWHDPRGWYSNISEVAKDARETVAA